MNNKRRAEVRQELTSLGYSAQYMNSWQPKVTMYLHKPIVNDAGTITLPVGTPMLNQPGYPDHVARKSRLGWLTWEPSADCKCKSCRERPVEIDVVPTETEADTVSLKCDLCDFVSESVSNLGAHSRLRGHKRRVHIQEAVPA